MAGVGGDGQVEAQEAVAADLQRDRRQDHRTGGRRFHVRVRQPGVDREHRHLDREGDHEGEEYPGLLLCAQPQRVQVCQLEAAALDVQVDQGHQHQHRAEEGVQEELHCRVDPTRTAPHADDQEHRHQHRFEEHVEQDRVGGGEDAHRHALQDQERGHVLVHALVDHAPGADQGQHAHQGGQQDQGDGDAVGTQVVVDAPGRDPGMLLYELHARVGIVEPGQQAQAPQEGDDRHRQRCPARRLRPGAAQAKDQGATDHRQPDQDTQKMRIRHVLFFRTVSARNA